MDFLRSIRVLSIGVVGSMLMTTPFAFADVGAGEQADHQRRADNGVRSERVSPSPRQILGQDVTTPGNIANFRETSPNTFFETLFDEVREKGSIRLRVGVAVPFAEEGLLTPSQVATQRHDIARAQQSLSERLVTRELRTFSTIPFMTVTVDEADLEALLYAPEVVLVERIKKHRPLLQESRGIIGADLAQQRDLTGSGWNVAVLDTGVNKNHPFLQGKVVAEACFSGDQGSAFDGVESLCQNGESYQIGNGAGMHCSVTDVDIDCGHGTHVAGIVSGNLQPSGLQGVSPGAGIMAVQVFSGYEECDQTEEVCIGAYDSDIIAALEYIYEEGRHDYAIAAINLSLGSERHYYTCDYSSWAMKSVVDNLRSVGIPTIAASGNEGWTNSIASPACISSVIPVGATWDVNFSNQQDYCPSPWSDPAGEVDRVACYSNMASSFDMLMAPGSLITSSVLGGGYEAWHGTSMAAPHVAACWALVKEAYPAMSVDEIKAGLKATSLSVTDWRTTGSSAPRINCYDAIDALLAFNDWSCQGTCGISAIDGVVTEPPVDEPVRWVSSNNSEEQNLALEGVGGSGYATNGSLSLSPAFFAEEGQVIEFYFNYVTSDGAGYSDYGWARLLDASMNEETLLFTSRTTPEGNTVPGFEMPMPTALISPATNRIIAGGPEWSALGSDSGMCYSEGCGYTGWIKATYRIPATGSFRLEVGVVNWNDQAYDSGLAFTMPYVGERRGVKHRGLPAWLFTLDQ